MKNSSNEFYLNEWEIWFTYTTSIRPTNIDLKSLADDLVESELAHFSMLKDGYTIWRSENKIGKGLSIVDFAENKNNAKVQFEKEDQQTIELENFALEAWYQCCYFRFSELRLFDPYPSLPPPYVRSFLGKCILFKDDLERQIHLYPLLTVYETGVMSVEFRTISPAKQLTLDDFITGAVNLQQIAFDRAEVPPALSRLASSAYMRSAKNWNFKERSKLLQLEEDHNVAVEERTKINDDMGDDFTFELSPLSFGEEDQKETLSTLGLTIFDSVKYLLSKPKKGWQFILWGQDYPVQFDGHWIGRPHIYLCDFPGQEETSSLNEEQYKSAFIKIVMQSSEFPAELNEERLPKDVRLFDDYSAYLSEALSLWVWSKKGIRWQEPWKDINRGHLIYEQQATMRLLDYVYILHRRLLNEISFHKNVDQVIIARRELIDIEQKTTEPSKFGEIRKLLKYGWGQLGLEDIKRRIHDSLELQQAEKSHQETRTYRKIGITLTVLFGLAVIPPVAFQILMPVWNWFNWPRPEDAETFSILLLTITSVVIIISAIFVLGSLKIKRKRSS